MFRFYHPGYLYLLFPLFLIAAYAFVSIARKRRMLKRFGDTALVKELMPGLSLRRKLIKDILLSLTLGLLVIVLARPQMGSHPEKVTKKGIEVMICMDISNSMLSDDVKPSRLAHTKMILSRVIDHLQDDKVGMVLFAGDAFVQLPITSDFVSAKMFLSNASPEMISRQGTAIGKAISLAARSFSSNEKSKKTILLVTDGENHEGGVEEAIEEAKKEGILINVIGVGTTEGGPIPLQEKGQYLTDETGNMVITKLNEQMCESLSQLSGGAYIHAVDVSGSVRAVKKSFDGIEKTEMETTVYNSYAEMYPYFLLAALLFLCIERILLERKNQYFDRFKLFER